MQKSCAHYNKPTILKATIVLFNFACGRDSTEPWSLAARRPSRVEAPQITGLDEFPQADPQHPTSLAFEKIRKNTSPVGFTTFLSFHPTICSIPLSFFHHLHHLSFPMFFAGFPIIYLSTPSATSTPGTSPRCHHLVMKPRPTPLAKGKPISGTHLEGNLRGLLKGLMIHGRSPGDVLFQTHHPTTILETFFENRCMGYR